MSRSRVDKCVELPLSGRLIVRAEKYEVAFITPYNGQTTLTSSGAFENISKIMLYS